MKIGIINILGSIARFNVSTIDVKGCIFFIFYRTRMSWCLVDKPREREFNHPDILPGQVYDAIQQCTLNFKMRTLACSTGDVSILG